MLSSRTWAALAAGIGLGLLVAALVITVWWMLTQRTRTLVVVRDDGAIEALLASAPSIVVNMPDTAGQRPMTVISPRAATGLEQWLGKDASALAAKGREVRAIILPSGHGGSSEDATVAALWEGRDIGLLRQWLSMRAEHWTAVGVEPVNASPQRMAAFAEATAFSHALKLRLGGDGNRWPVVVWRDGAGQLAVCYCDTPKAMAEARRALGLPDLSAHEQPVQVPAVPVARPAAKTASDDQEQASGYPRLNDAGLAAAESAETFGEVSETARAPMPALPGDAGFGQAVPQAKTAPAPRSAPRPASRPARAPRSDINTAAPKAEKDAESLFY